MKDKVITLNIWTRQRTSKGEFDDNSGIFFSKIFIKTYFWVLISSTLAQH